MGRGLRETLGVSASSCQASADSESLPVPSLWPLAEVSDHSEASRGSPGACRAPQPAERHRSVCWHQGLPRNAWAVRGNLLANVRPRGGAGRSRPPGNGPVAGNLRGWVGQDPREARCEVGRSRGAKAASDGPCGGRAQHRRDGARPQTALEGAQQQNQGGCPPSPRPQRHTTQSSSACLLRLLSCQHPG